MPLPYRLVLASLLSASVLASTASASADASPAAEAPTREGAWPLSPRPAIVRGFDPPDSPWGRGHRGVDLLGREGQSVHTSLAGRIVFAAGLAGRGVVVVDHGELRTTYEPVSASVSVGESVARGAVIGSLQGQASHCAPRACLHWGLLRGSTYLNPLLLVGGGPVRLLPVGLSAGPGTSWVDNPSSPTVERGRGSAGQGPVRVV